MSYEQWIAPIIGLLGTFGILALVVWRKLRHRKLRNERPPQTCKLLRPAGWSLLTRMDDIIERMVTPVLWALAGGGLFMIMAFGAANAVMILLRHASAWSDLPRQPQTLVLLVFPLGLVGSGLLVYWGVVRFSRLADELRNCRLGLRGEQAVAEAVTNRKVAAASYVAFHDVATDGPGNIDHVVIGPAGVFVIETKTRTKRKATRDQPEAEVQFDGRTLQFPWGDDPNAVGQVERNARWVRGFLGEFAVKDMAIHPLIVVPGWYVKTSGNFAVKVMNAKYLVGFLAGHDKRYRPEQLEPLIARFDEHCRTLEF